MIFCWRKVKILLVEKVYTCILNTIWIRFDDEYDFVVDYFRDEGPME